MRCRYAICRPIQLNVNALGAYVVRHGTCYGGRPAFEPNLLRVERISGPKHSRLVRNKAK